MSPLPRLHHHCCGVILHIRTVRCSTSRNVGALKIAQCTAVVSSALIVAEWSGHSVTVRVRASARAREWDFFVCVNL